MPQIIPIKDLKNTGEISELCKATQEPIFITKNGYGDMVIMSMDTYEASLYVQNLYQKIENAESEYAQGKTHEAFSSLKNIRNKYEI